MLQLISLPCHEDRKDWLGWDVVHEYGSVSRMRSYQRRMRLRLGNQLGQSSLRLRLMDDDAENEKSQLGLYANAILPCGRL